MEPSPQPLERSFATSSGTYFAAVGLRTLEQPVVDEIVRREGDVFELARALIVFETVAPAELIACAERIAVAAVRLC